MTTATAIAPAPKPASSAVQLDHLSWSAIKMYGECPRKFWYRYVVKEPEEFVPASLAFGTSVHLAAQNCYQSQLEGRAVPSVEALLDSFDHGWQTKKAETSEIRFAKDEDENSLREMAERMLTAFQQHMIANASKSGGASIIAIEHEHRFKLLPEVVPINMRLDVLELSGTDLIVTDIKTSRSRWNEAKVQEHLPQLVLYSVGLAPILRELGATRIVPRFFVITKAKTPIIQVLHPQASQQDVERIKRITGETWTAIQKNVFLPRESWGCAQCPFRGRCLGR